MTPYEIQKELLTCYDARNKISIERAEGLNQLGYMITDEYKVTRGLLVFTYYMWSNNETIELIEPRKLTRGDFEKAGYKL